MTPSLPDKTALVLSGGGARGAYVAGVVAGIIDTLGLRSTDSAPWKIFSGASVGAINGTYLATHAHRGDLGTAELISLWCDIKIEEYLRVDPHVFWRWLRGTRQRWFSRRGAPAQAAANPNAALGRSLFDSRPLERLIENSLPWWRLHRNIDQGQVKALLLAALEVSTGRTTIFGDLAPHSDFQPSPTPLREFALSRIGAEHVLASAAIPFVFPARRIGNRFFCDGGLRYNTPIAPAIRAGAERLVVISLRYEGEQSATADSRQLSLPESTTERIYPSPAFLFGKVLNALMLDPILYDLQILQRFNRLWSVLESTLTPEELLRVERVLLDTRRAPYRQIQTLHISPGANLGQIAADHLRNYLPSWKVTWLTRRVLKQASSWESDLISYLLFDGALAERYVTVGYEDARRRAGEIGEFFDPTRQGLSIPVRGLPPREALAAPGPPRAVLEPESTALLESTSPELEETEAIPVMEEGQESPGNEGIEHLADLAVEMPPEGQEEATLGGLQT